MVDVIKAVYETVLDLVYLYILSPHFPFYIVSQDKKKKTSFKINLVRLFLIEEVSLFWYVT